MKSCGDKQARYPLTLDDWGKDKRNVQKVFRKLDGVPGCACPQLTREREQLKGRIEAERI